MPFYVIPKQHPYQSGLYNLLASAAFSSASALSFSSAVRAKYDIIGLDPRGVGYSSPVQCDPDIFNERVPTLFLYKNGTTDVNDTAAFENLVNHNKRLGQSCANLTGPLLNYLDTITSYRQL